MMICTVFFLSSVTLTSIVLACWANNVIRHDLEREEREQWIIDRLAPLSNGRKLR